jgi:hypothetical protein
VLTLVAALGWRHHATARPEYALGQIVVAIREHDGTKLAYYADGGALADQVVDETVDWLVAQHRLDDALAGDEAGEAADRSTRIHEAKATFSGRIDRAAAAALLAKDADSAGISDRVIAAFTTEPPLSKIVLGEHLDVRSIDQSTISGSTATVPVTLRHRELYVDVTLGLVLQRDGPRWRLVGIDGMQHALATIDNAQLERIAIANRPREDELANRVALGAPTVQRVAHGRARTFYRLRVPVTNRSSMPIVDVALALSTRASDDEHATELSVHHLIPAQSTSAEVWQFDETESRSTHIAAMLTHPERLTLHVRRLVTDSAGQPDTLRLVRRYREIRAGE